MKSDFGRTNLKRYSSIG